MGAETHSSMVSKYSKYSRSYNFSFVGEMNASCSSHMQCMQWPGMSLTVISAHACARAANDPIPIILIRVSYRIECMKPCSWLFSY